MNRRGRLRLAALGCAAFVALPGAALATVYALSELRLERRFAVEAPGVAVPGDADAIARGRHLARAVAQCAHCHGDDLGGRLAADVPGLGRLYAPNLTSGKGGLGPDYRDEDLARAIRFGVDREGRALLVMPAQYLRRLRDDDLGDLIAYLRSVPPVDRELPAREVGLLARAALVLGRAPDLLPVERVLARDDAAEAADPEVAEGRYLVDLGACRVCHHDDLSGGLHPLAVPGEPPPSNLTPAGRLAAWSEADFFAAMRTGRTPDGRTLDPRYMPWPRFAELSNRELRAVWHYLRALPPRG